MVLPPPYVCWHVRKASFEFEILDRSVERCICDHKSDGNSREADIHEGLHGKQILENSGWNECGEVGLIGRIPNNELYTSNSLSGGLSYRERRWEMSLEQKPIQDSVLGGSAKNVQIYSRKGSKPTNPLLLKRGKIKLTTYETWFNTAWKGWRYYFAGCGKGYLERR